MFSKAINSIASLIASFIIIVSLFILNSDKTAAIVGYGLHKFNSAEKKVEVKNLKNNLIAEGNLLLLSPENIYISENDNNTSNITIIKRSDIIIKILK